MIVLCNSCLFKIYQLPLTNILALGTHYLIERIAVLSFFFIVYKLNTILAIGLLQQKLHQVTVQGILQPYI
jgi:hypothetical protein